jgi:FtsP/CotA-like multicopper oxidase with cupredoxin domain
MEMQMRVIRTAIQVTVLGAVFMILSAVNASAMIEGITGTTFNLTATTGHISTPDGGSYLIWGYANGAGLAQYPGPTLIVNQGNLITVTLTNSLTVAGGGTPPNVSIVFPGQQTGALSTDPGAPGILAKEAVSGGTVTYQFIATNPGTYTYYSGTDSALQVEMGLFGTIIVRPNLGGNYAYNHQDTLFDREYLFLLSEMDPRIHQQVETFGPTSIAATDYIANYFPVLWFINGRAAPDTMSEAGAPWLPNQPYNTMPRMHPGEKVLMRVVGGGRDLHPFHHHGSHARVIARDGRMLMSAPNMGPDLSQEVFTIQSQPGSTIDAIFEWTGKGLGWDIYGTLADGPQFAHTCTDTDADDFDDTTSEYCPDHYHPFPVQLPGSQELAFGGFYSGSPFLGLLEALPPGEGGLNPNGGYTYMWHSHTEKEMVNYDIFPGGMMTMLIIEAPGVPIP